MDHSKLDQIGGEAWQGMQSRMVRRGLARAEKVPPGPGLFEVFVLYDLSASISEDLRHQDKQKMLGEFALTDIGRFSLVIRRTKKDCTSSTVF